MSNKSARIAAFFVFAILIVITILTIILTDGVAIRATAIGCSSLYAILFTWGMMRKTRKHEKVYVDMAGHTPRLDDRQKRTPRMGLPVTPDGINLNI